MAWSARLDTLEIKLGNLIVDEVDDVAVLQPVKHIAGRAADDQANRYRRQASARWNLAEIPEQAGDDQQRDHQEDIAGHREYAEGRARVAAARELKEWRQRRQRLGALINVQIGEYPLFAGLVGQRGYG